MGAPDRRSTWTVWWIVLVTIATVSICLLMFWVLAARAVQSFSVSRRAEHQTGCLKNLRRIEVAKAEWARERHKKTGDPVRMSDLVPAFLNVEPKCPSEGTYDPGKIGEPPACSLSELGHALPPSHPVLIGVRSGKSGDREPDKTPASVRF